MWTDGHAYACEVLGSAGRGKVAVQFDDGMQYDAPTTDLRTFLDEPLYARPMPIPRMHARIPPVSHVLRSAPLAP